MRSRISDSVLLTQTQTRPLPPPNSQPLGNPGVPCRHLFLLRNPPCRCPADPGGNDPRSVRVDQRDHHSNRPGGGGGFSTSFYKGRSTGLNPRPPRTLIAGSNTGGAQIRVRNCAGRPGGEARLSVKQCKLSKSPASAVLENLDLGILTCKSLGFGF